MIAKKKLALLVMCSVLVVGLGVGGATYALFSDTVNHSANAFTAGTINLESKRNHGDYTPGPMFYPASLDPDGAHPYDESLETPSGESMGGWAPGDVVQRTMILRNEGSLDAKITGIKAIPRDSYTHQTPNNGSVTVTGQTYGEAYEEFLQHAHVLVSVPDQKVTLYDGPLSDLIFDDEDTFAPVMNELLVQGTEPPFDPGPLNVTFEVTLDKAAGNELQGANVLFDFAFFAEQARNNGE